MNTKLKVIAGAALLAAGIATILIQRSPEAQKPAQDVPENTASQNTRSSRASDGTTPTNSATNRSRPKTVDRKTELIAKYGESRTQLATQVSENVIGLMEDMTAIRELAVSAGTAGPFGARAGVGMALGRLGNSLNLSEEQQSKVADIYSNFQKRQLEESKATLARLKKDSTSLTSLMLASDAGARGDLTDEEYAEIQSASAKELTGVLNPLDQRNFSGAQPLRDETFISELKTVLDPTQAQTLEESLAQEQSNTPAPTTGNPSDIANIPKMELEKVDGTIQSVKKMSAGFKAIMEGMGGLQNLGPLTNPQNQGGPPPAGQ